VESLERSEDKYFYITREYGKATSFHTLILEVYSGRRAIQIHVYLYLYLIIKDENDKRDGRP